MASNQNTGFNQLKPSRGGSAGVIPSRGLIEMVDGSFMDNSNFMRNVGDDRGGYNESPARGMPQMGGGFNQLKPSKGSSRGVRSSHGTEMVDGSFMENGNFMNRSSPMTGGNQIPPQFMQGIPRGMEGMLVGGDSGAAMEMMGGGPIQQYIGNPMARGVPPRESYGGGNEIPTRGMGMQQPSFAPNRGNTQPSFAPNRGAAIPAGLPQSQGSFKPVTFRSGTGTSRSTAKGMTTKLNEPYSGLAGLVGEGTGLLGTAAGQAQQAPDQFSYNFNPEQAGQDLFNQRAELMQPQFAQQNAQAQEAMFGSGRLGLRLAGEGIGAGEGSGMMSPDAFGVNAAQSQALAGLAAQSTTDAFGQQMQRAGLDSNQFAMNQAGQQQRYANLMGSGQGMLSAGMQGTQLEQAMAQQQLQNQQLSQDYNLAQQNYNLAAQGQSQDYGLAQQNYGLAQQQQMQDYGFGMQNYGLAQQQQLQDYGFGMQDYGLNQQKMGLAQQQQQLDYGMAMLRGDQNYGLQRDVAAQNYELGTEGNRINLITGQAQANRANYQPDPLLGIGVGLGSSFLGSESGSGWLSELLKGL